MTPDTTTYYYLSLSVLDARTQTTVNGVGIHEGDGKNSLSFNSPMNANLIGTGNRVRVTVRPTMIEADGAGVDSLRPTTLDEAQVTVTVKKITDGVVAPETGEVLARQTLQDAVEARRRELQRQFNEKIQSVPPTQRPALADRQEELTRVTFPVQLELTFDSKDVPSFRHRFETASLIQDDKRVREFAMRLRDLASEGETRKLYDEMKPKYIDYDIAYPTEAADDGQAEFDEVMEEYFYSSGPMLEFESDDLRLKEWASGRIWEVNVDRVPPADDKFFYTKGLNGTTWRMDIFVGEVDGELKVVR